jgi:hypothetical protein
MFEGLVRCSFSGNQRPYFHCAPLHDLRRRHARLRNDKPDTRFFEMKLTDLTANVKG